MQIGVQNDPGLKALLYGSEGAELIVPPCYVLTMEGVRSRPRQNIIAAVGYLLMRMADYGYATVPDPGGRIVEVTARPGDSLATLAKRCGSTLDMVRRLNPSATVIQVGQVLKCQAASMRKVIIGWKPFTYATVSRRYNGNGNPSGDPRYAEKLEYVFDAIRKRNDR